MSSDGCRRELFVRVRGDLEVLVLGNAAQVPEAEQREHQHDAGQDERSDGRDLGDLTELPETRTVSSSRPRSVSPLNSVSVWAFSFASVGFASDAALTWA